MKYYDDASSQRLMDLIAASPFRNLQKRPFALLRTKKIKITGSIFFFFKNLSYKMSNLRFRNLRTEAFDWLWNMPSLKIYSKCRYVSLRGRPLITWTKIGNFLTPPLPMWTWREQGLTPLLPQCLREHFSFFFFTKNCNETPKLLLWGWIIF